jgi:hypothetical protein
MLNSLANHGYLPRDGKNLDLAMVKRAFLEGINFAADEFTGLGVSTALTISSTSDASRTFNLRDLSRHNVIEHDGSLSRNDAYFGDVERFDPRIWDMTRSHFTGDTIPLPVAAQARKDRLATAKAANPQFTLTEVGGMGSLAETALYSIVLGDRVDGNPKTAYVRTLFGESRTLSPFRSLGPLLRSSRPADDYDPQSKNVSRTGKGTRAPIAALPRRSSKPWSTRLRRCDE